MHEIQKNAEHHGIIVDGARLDIDKMMAQKDNAVSGLTKGIEGLFKKYKVGGAHALALGNADLSIAFASSPVFTCTYNST